MFSATEREWWAACISDRLAPSLQPCHRSQRILLPLAGNFQAAHLPAIRNVLKQASPLFSSQWRERLFWIHLSCGTRHRSWCCTKHVKESEIKIRYQLPCADNSMLHLYTITQYCLSRNPCASFNFRKKEIRSRGFCTLCKALSIEKALEDPLWTQMSMAWISQEDEHREHRLIAILRPSWGLSLRAWHGWKHNVPRANTARHLLTWSCTSFKADRPAHRPGLWRTFYSVSCCQCSPCFESASLNLTSFNQKLFQRGSQGCKEGLFEQLSCAVLLYTFGGSPIQENPNVKTTMTDIGNFFWDQRTDLGNLNDGSSRWSLV